MGCGNSNGSIGSGGCALSPKVTYQAQKPAGCVLPFQGNDPRQSLYGQGRPQTGTAVKGDPYRGYISARTPSFPRGNGTGPSPDSIVARNQPTPQIPINPRGVSPLGGVGSSTPMQPLQPMKPGVNLYPSGGGGGPSPVGTPSTPMYGTPKGTASPVGGTGTTSTPVGTPTSPTSAPGKTPTTLTGEGGPTTTSIPGVVPPGNGDKVKPPVVLSVYNPPLGATTKAPDGSLYGDLVKQPVQPVEEPYGTLTKRFPTAEPVKQPDGTYPGEYPSQDYPPQGYVEPKYAEQPPPWQSDYIMPGTQGWQPPVTDLPMPDKGYVGSLDQAQAYPSSDFDSALVNNGTPVDLNSMDPTMVGPIPQDALNADNNLSPKGTVSDDLMGSLARSSGFVRPGNRDIYKQPRLAPLPAQRYANDPRDPRTLVRPRDAGRTGGAVYMGGSLVNTQTSCLAIPGARWIPAAGGVPAYCQVEQATCRDQGGTIQTSGSQINCQFPAGWTARAVTSSEANAASVIGSIGSQIVALFGAYNQITTARSAEERQARLDQWENEARERLDELRRLNPTNSTQESALATLIAGLESRMNEASGGVSTNTLLLVGGGLAAVLVLGGVMMLATRRR